MTFVVEGKSYFFALFLENVDDEPGQRRRDWVKTAASWRVVEDVPCERCTAWPCWRLVTASARKKKEQSTKVSPSKQTQKKKNYFEVYIYNSSAVVQSAV